MYAEYKACTVWLSDVDLNAPVAAMPDATATALLARCHHPLVRDLAWLLLAPDLVDSGWPARPSRRELGLDDGDRLAAFLDDLEAAPETLEQRVGDTVNGRMGLYHERLWQYLLDRAPGTCLLAHNLRVHRGKLTLGELDLLYRRRDTPSLIHLEVAIKFYLGLPEGPGDAADPAHGLVESVRLLVLDQFDGADHAHVPTSPTSGCSATGFSFSAR